MFNRITKLFFIGAIGIMAPLFAPPPPLPGMERLFVTADIPEHVRFSALQNYVKVTLDPQLQAGPFHNTEIHTTFLYVGDIPQAQVPQVIHAVNKAIDIFQQQQGTHGMNGFYALPGGQIFGTNAVGLMLHAPQESYALADILDRQVSAVTGQHSLGYIPHVTLGRLPKADVNAPILGIFLPTLLPPTGARGPAETFSISRVTLSSTVGKGYNTLVAYDLKTRRAPAIKAHLKKPGVAVVAAFAKAKNAVKKVAHKIQGAKPAVKYKQKAGLAIKVPGKGKSVVKKGAKKSFVHKPAKKQALKKRKIVSLKKGFKKIVKKVIKVKHY